MRRLAPRFVVAALALLPMLLASGCARFPENPPLRAVDSSGYRFENLARGPGNSNETLLILTLSGGGTRAAALAYGVLDTLEAARRPDGRGTLLDEVDVISSVSGGSFAAAHLGVFGKDRFLREFPDAVLKRNLEWGIVGRMLLPWNAWKVASPSYGRSDLADAYYARAIFGDARFSGLRLRPYLRINATDLTSGAHFAFTQNDFDRLCSDVGPVRLSRAVTASSAFPIAFSPVTLRNHPRATCDGKTPAWVRNALEYDAELNPRRYDRAKTWKAFEDERRRFIHLSDGGLSDNIGLRGPMLGLESPASDIPLIRMLNDSLAGEPGDRIRRVVFLVVDARPEADPEHDASSRPPGILAVLAAAATRPMENYSAETVDLMRGFIDEWQRQFSDAEEPSPIAFYRIHVRFESEPDPDRRRKLQRIGTRLRLSDEQVDLAVQAGRDLLGRSEQYRCLLAASGFEADSDRAISPGSADALSDDCPEPLNGLSPEGGPP